MNGDNMLNEILQLVVVLIVFCGVLALSYYGTQKIGHVNKKVNANKNMEIIEVLPLMQGQYLYIVKVAGRYFLLGCSQKGNISYLNELNEKDLIFKEGRGISFQEHLMQLMKGKQVKEDEEKDKEK